MPLNRFGVRIPVMMIHGMCCTGGVWRNFRALFEARGADVYAPTLRPDVRTREKPPFALRNVALDDYLRDLENEARRLQSESGVKPAVIGHSMGGLIVQALAERNLVSAAVCISPSAPAGVRTASMRAFWFALSAGRALRLTPPTIAPRRSFANRLVFNLLSKRERNAAFAELVHESGRALLDLGDYSIEESRISAPLLVVSASRDLLVPAALVRLTWQKYSRIGAEFLEYPNHAHWLLAEPGWKKPASDIYDWLNARV